MMLVHRIGHVAFIDDTEGIGAKKFGGRWNPVGIACLYCSEHLSLAVLEKFVHAQGRNDMLQLATRSFAIPAAAQLYKVDTPRLSKGWENDFAYTQWLGQQILEDTAYAGFIVPSVIVPGEHNVVLNPLSPLFKKVEPQLSALFAMDSRLLAHV